MKKKPIKRIKFNLHNPDVDIQIIENVLKRNRNAKVTGGIVLIILGIAIILTSLNGLPSKTVFTVAVLCMLIGFTGFYFLLSGILKYDTQKNYLLRLITHHPEEVVWVYYKKEQFLPFGIQVFAITSLHIQLLNRESICLQMPEGQIEQLVELLQFRLHQATFGYSRYKEQLYNISPDLLSK